MGDASSSSHEDGEKKTKPIVDTTTSDQASDGSGLPVATQKDPNASVLEVDRRRLVHLDEFLHSSPVPLALFLMMFAILGMVWLRFTRSSAEPKKRSRKEKAIDAKPRNSPELSC